MGTIRRRESEREVHARVHPRFVHIVRQMYSEERTMYNITKKMVENQEMLLYGKKTKKK